jgi:3-dehydroquinate synthase
MSERLTVRSLFRDYVVDFVEDWASALGEAIKKEAFFLVDKGVLDLYSHTMRGLLPEGRTFTLEATEPNKTLERCGVILKALVEKSIRKNHVLVAIGGGVLQDITGFVASVLYRGIGWHFVPTTLLAQADSCIGSKTSINLGEYKNLLGNFYPPARILIDANFLTTLPPDEVKSGIGEILHFYLIDDSPLTAELSSRYDEFLVDPLKLTPFIRESLRIKQQVVVRDEFDRGERNLFNYGHTFGHALESVTRYRVNHGQAVTWGMDLANRVSVEFGYLDRGVYHEMHRILMKNMPSLSVKGTDLEEYFRALARDKKNVGSTLGCILSRGPGRMFKTQISLDDRLREIITDYLETQTVKG